MIKGLLIIVFLFFSYLHSDNDENKKIPKLDLRDGAALNNINIGTLNNILPDRKKENETILSEYQINKIKLISEQFIPESLNANDIIILSTNLGKMEFKFYHNESPINSLNFKKLCNSQFYDKTLFHYVVPEFIIQGGDILSRNNNPNDDGQGGPGWTVDAEHNNLKHGRGTLSMVRTMNDVNSAGSQFFISLKENKTLDSKYTIFAYLINGDHILSRIAKIPSEYYQAKLLCKLNIPSDENNEDWVTLYDHIKKINIYSKVPKEENKSNYQEVLQNRLKNNYRPGIPVIVDSIRVINDND